MKLTKHSNITKSRVVSCIVCISFILCTIFSFGIFGPSRIAYADGVVTPPATKTETGIRFVQVAAGSDFAIGLTYDRKLYGWSLNESENSSQSNPATLGEYYSVNPTEIKVTFRNGPGSGGAFKWNDTSGTENYHSTVNDYIVSIAATRYTAAFYTNKGYIYTWGQDSESASTNGVYPGHDVRSGESNKHYLLLRAVDAAKEYTWTQPYIIDYHYYGSKDEDIYLNALIPSSSQDVSFARGLAASEYNYIFMFTKPYSSDNYLCTYVWGSLMYALPHVNPGSEFQFNASVNNLQGGFQQRRVFKTGYYYDNDDIKNDVPVSVVGGGYTLGINGATATGGTSLQIRGRNFLTTQGVTSSTETVESKTVNKLTVTATTSVVNTSANVANITYAHKDTATTPTPVPTTYTVVNAIAGNRSGGSNNSETAVTNWTSTPEQYYARQAGSQAYSVGAASQIKSAQSNTALADTNYAKPVYYAVSLGNDVGYGISENQLYGWGDNAVGQLTLTISGEENKYKQAPTGILTGKSIVSVAAGKQLSGKPAFYTNTNTTTDTNLPTVADTIGGNAFVAGVKNSTDYITGALDSTGSIWAWGKSGENTVSTPTVITHSDYAGGNKFKFAAVYSGYGNNLFAVTDLGKLVRITIKGNNAFEVQVYDEFYNYKNQSDSTATKVTNWDVDSSNNVVFTVPPANATQQAGKPLGEATFYVWSSNAPQFNIPASGSTDAQNIDTVMINGTRTSNGWTNGTYRTLVSSNAIGDAYRIVGIDGDYNTKFIKNASGLSNTAANEDYYKPRFIFDADATGGGTQMTDAQQNNMFGVAMVCDANGVGIKITPKRSSKGKKITIKFYIARYDSYANFAKSGSTGADNAIYYDYKPCMITFSIDDTPTQKVFQPYAGDNGTGKCNIPLLDPNNEYNKQYSLAVQNVSTGVDELNKYLTGSVNTTLKGLILAKMKTEDSGFPDSAKKAAGHLDYYLGAAEADAKYNDVYQYLFADRDGDRIKVNTPSSGLIVDGDGATGKVDTITVTVPLSGITLNTSIDGGRDAYVINKRISTDFDNIYGLYNIELSNDKTNLTFKYDVVRFTGTGSTGSLAYGTSQSESGTIKITDYQTTKGSQSAKWCYIDAKSIAVYGMGDEGYVADTDESKYVNINGDNIATVFSEPTVRLKSNLASNVPTDKIDIYGKGGVTANKYTQIFADSTLYVGETVDIELKNYLDVVGNRIFFSYNNSIADAELKKFGGQFLDETGNNYDVVKLVNNKITIKPTVAAPIDMTVVIQRFANETYTATFASNTLGTTDKEYIEEKIYLTIKFPNVSGFSFQKTAYENDGNQKGLLITKTSVIDVFGGSLSENSYNTGNPLATITDISGVAVPLNVLRELKARTKIYGLIGSNNDVFTCSAGDSNTSITITPKSSGSGVVQFTAITYGVTLSFAFKVNISYVTTIEQANAIKIIDDGYITVKELTSKLASANSFNDNIDKYKILYDDVQNPDARATDKLYNAIYFTNSNGDRGTPSFVKNAIFENITGAADIRIISSNSSTRHSETYYMHVKYTSADVTKYEDAPAGTIVEIVVPITSGKVKLQDQNIGGDLTVAIDCRNPQKQGNWWTTEGSGINTQARIDLAYLLELDDAESPNEYTIFLVKAGEDSGAEQYFNYATAGANRLVVITPINNTPYLEGSTTERQSYELNISVYKPAKNSVPAVLKVYSVAVSVTGIIDVLPVSSEDGIIGYGNIWLYSFAIVFGTLTVLFVVRFTMYMKKRAKQRAIIKRNQELIRMRDRIHGKATSATREQIVRTKLKMEDPKYAKIFNDMRKNKENESGIVLENSELAAVAAKKSKKKGKGGGKKTVAELKAELEAKKAAFAAAQSQNEQPVNPFVADIPMDGGFDGGAPFGGQNYGDQNYGGQNFGGQDMDGGDIIFDASDSGDGM